MPTRIRVRQPRRVAAPKGGGAPLSRVLPIQHTRDGWAVDTIRWDLVPDYDYEQACEGLSEEGIRQELEIDWSATKGRRVYPQFGRSHHVSVGDLRFNPRATVYCGWDFGGVPAFCLTQLNTFNQWLVFPSLSPPDSVTLGVYEFGQLVADLLQREYASPYGLEIGELKLVHFGDPAGAARPPRTGDRPRETQSCFEILNRGLILHAGEGVGGSERPERRPGWGWKIRPGAVNITARLEAVRARLMLNLRDGLPALVVDHRAHTIIEAFQGGYCYPVRADGQYGQDPEKNWYSHCLPGDTLIETLWGEVPIRNVVAGDWVMTRRGWRKVRASWCSGMSEVVEIRLVNKTVLRATPKHKIWADGEWVEAVSLRYNQICDVRQSNFKGYATPATLTRRGGATATTFGTGVERGAKDCTGHSGRPLTEPFRTGATSTIRTATHSIMTWKIWSVFRLPGTVRSTLRSAARRNNGWLSIWSESAPWLPTGTSRRQGESGTGSTDEKRRRLRRCERLFVSSAESPTNQPLPTTGTGSAVAIAKPRSATGPGWITKSEPAGGAVWYLPRTNTRNPATALSGVVGVTKLPGSWAVYDLDVEGEHEFYANGVLVHNSMDALGYIGTRLFHQPKEEEDEDETPRLEFRSRAAARDDY